MNGPKYSRIPVDSSQVRVVGEEGPEGGPEDGGGHTHEDGGDEDVSRVEDEQLQDEEAVGERGEEEAGAGAQRRHQARGGQAGQSEGGVGHGGAAIQCIQHLGHLMDPYMRLELTLNSSPPCDEIEL